jgi:hypothetical protein
MSCNCQQIKELIMKVINDGFNNILQIFRRGNLALTLHEIATNSDGSRYLICDCVRIDGDEPVLLIRTSVYRNSDGAYCMRIIDGYMTIDLVRKYGDDPHRKLFHAMSSRTIGRLLAMYQSDLDELLSN